MQIKHLIFPVLVSAIWGFNFIFVKLGVHDVPPLFLCALRFFLASFPAMFFVKWPKAPIILVILYGLVTFGLQFALIFSSFIAGMTAGMASLLMQSQVFFSIFFAIIFLGERISTWQILGALIAFSGILLAAMHLDCNMTLAGFVLIISAAISWGIGTLITKKMGKVSTVGLIVWGSVIACVPLLLLSLLIEGQQQIIASMLHLSWTAIMSLIYIVYVSTWIGYGLWNWLLNRYPVITIVPFTLLVPVFGMLGAVVILGESIELWKATVAILIISGLFISLIVPHLSLKLKSSLIAQKRCIVEVTE